MWLVLLVFSIAAAIASGIFIIGAEEGNSKLKWPARGTGIFAIVCAIGFLWITRPWWHWLWFNCIYMAPTVWIIIGVTVGLAIWLWKIERTRWFWTVIVIGCFLLFITPVLARPLTMCKIYSEIKPATTIIETLPETSEIRYLPMEVAAATSRIRIGTPTRTVGDFDPVINKGPVDWVTPLVPSGSIRGLTRQMEGIALIKSDGTAEFSEEFFKYGEGMAVLDDITWKLREHRYFVDYSEIFYWYDGDKPIAVAPYLKYKFEFPVRVPYWGGVCIVYPDGTIKDYTPEETRNLPFLKGQRLLPEKLAKYYVESWAYLYGIWNKWFYHEDQIVIPTLAYSENQMPYLMPIGKENKPNWMVTTEPFGRAFGLSKIFFVDAREVKMEIYETAKWDRERQKYQIIETLIGPNTAWGFAKGAPGVAQYKWIERAGGLESEKGAGEGTWRLIEPRPTFIAGKLSWMLTVTSSDYTVVQHTILVDAAKPKENRFTFDTEKELRDFLAGKVVALVPEKPTVPTVPPEKISPEVISQVERMNQMYQDFQKQWQAEWTKLMEMLKGGE